MKPRALVAMSGGVDSSVAAALMVEAGYDVIGVMLKLWRGDEINHASGCCSVGAADDARRVADVLGIDFYVFNMAEEFADSVIRDFHETYAAGRTPNPCVRCNQWIKFDALLERADALDADLLATGHYARVAHEGGRYRLLRGVDERKDQSYVLWMLTQSELARVAFPVGAMAKARTRAMAAELGLRTAAKPDSQEICFVRGGDLEAYMDANLPSEPGPLVDTAGRVVGTHRGIARYTVGQRRGLGVALGAPVFVAAIDAAANTVVLGSRSDLAVAGLSAGEASWVAHEPEPGTQVLVQHRAHGEVSPATLTAAGPGGFAVTYDAPAHAVAPGQSAALYAADRPEELLGGGIIAATTPAPS